ncbi:MAG: hypothetical protein Q9174_000022 [Haloplaca sp. 1 TL-2023]
MARHSSPGQQSYTNILQSNLDDLRNTVRDITQTFIGTAALLPPGETTEDHERFRKEEAESVEKDKASLSGLFNGRFKPSSRTAGYRAPIRDGPDGVDRCPMCTWELEEGMCNSCGYTAIDAAFDNEDESLDSATYSMDSAELEEMLGDEDLDFDDAHPEIDRPPPRMIEDMRRRAGLPAALRHHRRAYYHPSPDPSANTEASDDDDSSDESESEGSLREFVADDTGLEGNIDEVDDSSLNGSDSDHASTAGEDRPERRRTGARYRQRHDYPRIRFAESSDRSDRDETTYGPRSRRHGLHGDNDEANDEANNELAFGSPQSSAGGSSQDIPIQVDSDSDGPPVRHSRRRAAPLSISSEEDNHTRRVNNSHSRTNTGSPTRASSSSPEHSMARPLSNRPSNEDTSTSATVPAPILIGSSPARADSPRGSESPHQSRPPRPFRPRCPPSDSLAAESTDDEALITRRSRAAHRARSNSQADDEGQSSSRAASVAGPPEQLLSSFNRRRAADPVQHRRERKRMRLERRRRDRQNSGARDRDGFFGAPQHLSYMGV